MLKKKCLLSGPKSLRDAQRRGDTFVCQTTRIERQGSLKGLHFAQLKHVAFSTPKYRETTVDKAMFRGIV